MPTNNAPPPDDDLARDLKRRAVPDYRTIEDEVHHTLVEALKEDLLAKSASFLARTAELRFASEGRRQTSSELLIREDRDHRH